MAGSAGGSPSADGHLRHPLPCLALFAEHGGEGAERLVHAPAIGENVQHGGVDDHDVGPLPVSCRGGAAKRSAKIMFRSHRVAIAIPTSPARLLLRQVASAFSGSHSNVYPTTPLPTSTAGSADLRLLQVCGSSHVPTRKAAGSKIQVQNVIFIAFRGPKAHGDRPRKARGLRYRLSDEPFRSPAGALGSCLWESPAPPSGQGTRTAKAAVRKAPG
jgi:hypothetical protein